MDYKGKDFHGDRVQRYAALRVAMAKQYGDESFGPTETHFLDDEEMTTQEQKEQKDKVKANKGLIKIGYNLILEKSKKGKNFLLFLSMELEVEVEKSY